MSTNDWKSIAEFIGIAAIVASLIFVGLQMRQSHEIALSERHSTRTGTIIEQIMSVSENPYFLSAQAKRSAGKPEEITPVEREAMRQIANAMIYGTEDAFFQYKNGFLSEERWNASRETMRWFMSGDAHIQAREVYEQNPDVWSSEFQQVVDEIIRELDASAATAGE